MTVPITFERVDRAIDAFRSGRPVIVVDDERRTNQGGLLVAAELVTRETMAFLVRHTSGFVAVALREADADRLGLPPMRAANQDRHRAAYGVTVDARDGVTTGISARDRARTARLLGDPASGPADFNRPGHVVPLRARPGGVH
ncbi:MAG: 3,4-dihydroxy-2-butanone-4-phosphate synthase, partial [Gordonia sp. (in: high G+C Gram-positive bacteria)]